MKKIRYFEWAICFWIGIGLMSIINVWRFYINAHSILYSWIMFGISLLAISICMILIKLKKVPTGNRGH